MVKSHYVINDDLNNFKSPEIYFGSDNLDPFLNTSQFFVATHAAALQQHVVQIEGAIFGEWDEPVQDTWVIIQ